MPVLTCYDCEGRRPDTAKVWLYPCQECAQGFIANHQAAGHHIHAREETYSDRWSFGTY